MWEYFYFWLTVWIFIFHIVYWTISVLVENMHWSVFSYLYRVVLIDSLNPDGSTKHSLGQWDLCIRVHIWPVSPEVIRLFYSKCNKQLLIAHCYPNCLTIFNTWEKLTANCIRSRVLKLKKLHLHCLTEVVFITQ